ncbi:MAG: DUF2029 domain-containing protein [Planctomycetaceae bacterium]|nr:DUF2029 domain-containing protein [Planctomycetaceae bacterium]
MVDSPDCASWLRPLVTAVAAALVLVGAVSLQKQRQLNADGVVTMNDAVQFWCAGTLIRQGRSPYEIEGQATISSAAGWDRETTGIGRYDFMPYYYPYWLGLAAAPLTVLNFETFVATWTVLQYFCLLMAAVLLSQLPDKYPRLLTSVLIIFFPLATQVADMGQVACGLLMLLALLWWSVERRRDLMAGLVLAVLCSKPQLTVLVVPCVLVWAWPQDRKRIILGFAGGVAALLGVCTLLHPTWIIEFLRAPSATPMLTGSDPWKLTTWNAVCRSLGADGFWLMAMTAIVAIPAALWTLSTAWRRESSFADVVSVGLLAVWFVSPYGRSYDMVVLLFPLVVLIGKCAMLPRVLITGLFLLGPHAYQRIRWQREIYPFWGLEIWWSWVPVGLLLLWIAQERGWLEAWDDDRLPRTTFASPKASAVPPG